MSIDELVLSIVRVMLLLRIRWILTVRVIFLFTLIRIGYCCDPLCFTLIEKIEEIFVPGF